MQFSLKETSIAFSSALLLQGCSLLAKTDTTETNVQHAGLFEVPLLAEQPLETLHANRTALYSCKCDYEKRFTVFMEDRSILDSVSKKIYHLAIMSSNAYDRSLQISIPEWRRVKRVVSMHGFSADIYMSNDQQEVVVAFRGTDDVNDWKYANADMDANGQYLDADKLFGMVRKEYRDKKITATGHSLGGGLAIHVSLGNEGVDAYVFNPSPRLFAGDNYGKHNNRVVVIYESGEILSLIRPLFSTLRKVKYEKYRFNFLGGNTVTEHSIEAFSWCMYASIGAQNTNYRAFCKKNTVRRESK